VYQELVVGAEELPASELARWVCPDGDCRSDVLFACGHGLIGLVGRHYLPVAALKVRG
jgi:hypothetical protein